MSRSPKLQRLTAMAVPALLAANAMVLVVAFGPEDAAKPAGAETVTYIQGADGTLRLVDPTTPEGWKAIADANERGETVVTVPEGDQPAELMQQSATSTTLAPDVTTPVDQLLDDTESTVVDTIEKVGETVDGVVREVTGKIDDTAGTNIGDIVNPVVDEGTDTLTTTVSTVVRETRSTATTIAESAPEAPADEPPVTAPEPVAEVVPDEAAEELPVEVGL